MNTDNGSNDKLKFTEQVLNATDPRFLSEAVNYSFEKRRSPVAVFAAAACLVLVFAASILLFKPRTERGQAALSPTPQAVESAERATDEPTSMPEPTASPAAETPDPNLDIEPVFPSRIRGKRIVYADVACVIDYVPAPGTVILCDCLNRMLADERYRNCVFAVDILIDGSMSFAKENAERYAQLENDPAILLYNELYEQFVEENLGNYQQYVDKFYTGQYTEPEGERPKEQIEEIVFTKAFKEYLYDTDQLEVYQNYSRVRDHYSEEMMGIWNERLNGEVLRFNEIGFPFSQDYRWDDTMKLFGLLTRDQLVNFTPSPEFAYVITLTYEGGGNDESAPVPPADNALHYSDHYDYLKAAHALLAGELPERTDFRYFDQYVYFRLEDDGLRAYNAVKDAESSEPSFADPIAVFPREVGELANQRLREYWEQHVRISVVWGEEADLIYEGFVGENWFALVTVDDSMQDIQVHCIFYFDGSEWHEIIGNNGGLHINGDESGSSHTIFGACVLDENNAIVCYYTKWFFGEDASPCKLYIYRTCDGGKSWGRLDIVLPESYNDMPSYAPLSPVFDESGTHGVIILDTVDSSQLSWLESFDGGESWEYRSRPLDR